MPNSRSLKVGDRASFSFALVSVAAALELARGIVKDARIVLGGVAHKPWRVVEAERALVGRPLDDAAMQAAADLLLRGARPHPQNAFKVELARRSIVRALRVAGGLA